MQNSFKTINETVDNLLVISSEEGFVHKIEKDILLEKLRKAYLQCQALKEEENTENEEVPPMVTEPEEENTPEAPSPEPEYEVSRGMTDDVDLFFDTDHESYGAPEEGLEAVEAPAPMPELNFDLKPEPAPEVAAVEASQPSQKAPKPEMVIDPEPLAGEEEDDLLQFIPQKAAPQREPTEEKKAPRSLNDLFNKQQEDRSLGGQFQRAKVGDLTKAISINDKFTFIKELFNNKGEEFSAAIQQLNQCASMDEAFDCLEGLKKKYYWDTTATAYLSLCDLLRRKYL